MLFCAPFPRAIVSPVTAIALWLCSPRYSFSSSHKMTDLFYGAARGHRFFSFPFRLPSLSA